MLRRHRLDAVECKGELEIDRLLRPKRTVIVEHSDALGRRNKVRAALSGDARDEIGDRRFRRAVIQGRQLGPPVAPLRQEWRQATPTAEHRIEPSWQSSFQASVSLRLSALLRLQALQLVEPLQCRLLPE